MDVKILQNHVVPAGFIYCELSLTLTNKKAFTVTYTDSRRESVHDETLKKTEECRRRLVFAGWQTAPCSQLLGRFQQTCTQTYCSYIIFSISKLICYYGVLHNIQK